ncbi:glycosyltransferase [Halomonas sp. ATCH28]|uniref:Glycosyltransferase n=1 Tax=Halomonas gemina TaxID=2945105 RepID=A0ABT0SX53_9GAMM|nr:glycosyltransferase [Halomonas gemina]MCL7939236.1 glycosyltransferase [Halomonas gemina]
MMRILFLADHLGGGGAPVSILSLAKALSARGFAITIVSLQDKVWREVPSDVDIHVVSFQPRGPWQKLRRYHLHARLLDQWFRDQPGEFDLVVANLHYTHQVVTRSSLAERAWLCMRTDPSALLEGHRYNHRLRQLIRLYNGRRVIALSRGILNFLAAKGVALRDSVVIHNIIDANYIQTMMQESVGYEDYIVFVGRLEKRQKRYDRLLRAYINSGISQDLVVVGDGEINEARKLADDFGITERVHFVGEKSNPYAYMHHARLLVLSSDSEGFGRVIVESLVCGTPVVSTDCPSGPREILKGELSDCLVPLDEGELLGKKIKEMIANPPTIRAEHYAPFSAEVVTAEYLRLMEITS